MNRTTIHIITACIVAAVALPTLAQHDHEGHPDLHIEIDGTQLEFHADNPFANHEHFEFIDAGGGTWVTLHDGLTWPGIGADDGTFAPYAAADLILTTPLYYWDGASPAGYAAVTDNTAIQVKATAFSSAYTITGSSGTQTASAFISADADGGVHMHPIWTLLGDGGAPADGAYLLGLSIDVAGFDPADTVYVLFHKGLTDPQYDAAVDQARAQALPEPASIGLIALGGFPLLRRRR